MPILGSTVLLPGRGHLLRTDGAATHARSSLGFIIGKSTVRIRRDFFPAAGEHRFLSSKSLSPHALGNFVYRTGRGFARAM
jgi:hypothetical protein